MASTTIKGFIVTSTYSVSKEGSKIHLFGRCEDNSSFEAVFDMKPYFFIKQDDEKRTKELLNITPRKPHSKNLKTMQDDNVSVVEVSSPKEIPVMRNILESENIPCFEADIPFTRRFLIDNNLFSQLEIKGEYKRGGRVDKKFINPSIQPLSTMTAVAKPTILSFDIETDVKAKTIYSISVYTKNVKKVFVVANESIREHQKELTTAHIVENEKELIRSFVDSVKSLNPDIITGWNVIDFDLKVIQEKAKEYNIKLDLGRDNKELSTRIESSFFRDSSAVVSGRLILDGIHLLRSSFIELENYKLNTAAKEFLDDEKLLQGEDRFEEIEKKYHTNPKEFIAYNLKDSKLVYDILFASGVYDLTITRSLLTGLHMDGVKGSIASFDSMYLRELRKRGFVAMSSRPQDSTTGLGGFVMTSKPGIYDNILVLDFKSLYPSIMRTFNIDPLSFLGTKDNLKITKENLDNSKKYIISPNGAVFENNEGIIPQLLERMWHERDKAKEKGNMLTRYAIKIHMNSMYGVLASPNSRYHNRALSNAITYFGQLFIKKTAEFIEHKGFEVIYGDTDSVFINPKTEMVESAVEIGKQIEKDTNEFLKQHIEREYKRKSILLLEFEKIYTKFFLPSVRGESNVGAKKRYAGLKLQDDGTTSLDFTGLEFVRRDWTELSKEFQMKLLDLIFAKKPVEPFIKKYVENLKEGKHDNLLVYRKALRKPIEEYTKTTPPHVKAAKKLDNITSNVISYIITVKGPEPVEKQEHEPDYEHYIEKQIKPIAESILRIYNKKFDDILKGSRQQGLTGFMK
ncbi:MAG: DNA polymerase II [Nanobdellota archaeon]